MFIKITEYPKSVLYHIELKLQIAAKWIQSQEPRLQVHGGQWTQAYQAQPFRLSQKPKCSIK